MTRDKMIEALAKAAYCHDGAKPYPWDSAARGDKYADQWDRQRSQAESIAAAVLDLCGPEKLVWVYDDGGIYANSYGGMYRIEYGDDGGMYLENSSQNYESNHNSEEAAQAAAQSHATAAHWSQTPLGKLVGVV